MPSRFSVLCLKFKSDERKWIFHCVSNAVRSLFYFRLWILTNFRSGKDRGREFPFSLSLKPMYLDFRAHSFGIFAWISRTLHFAIFSHRMYNFREMDRYGKMFIFRFQIYRNCLSKFNAIHRNIRYTGMHMQRRGNYILERLHSCWSDTCRSLHLWFSSWETTRARVRLTLLLPP